MNESLHISPQGVAMVQHFEDCWLTAKPDEVGVPTIGWGETSAEGHIQVVNGMTITQARADELLMMSLGTHEDIVKRVVKVELTQSQFDALVSFDFNLGSLAKSTLLVNLNNNARYEAVLQFGLWVKAGGRVLAGLVRRRNAERDLFCGFGWERWKA